MAAAAIAAALVLANAAPASAADLVNGGFETGTLAGWTAFASSQYVAWVPQNAEGAAKPPFPKKFPPIEGAYSAYTEELAEGTAILYQDVALEPDATDQLRLSFGYAAEGEMVTPASGSLEVKEGVPNQQLRIDVMKPTAPLESVAPDDILATVFATHTGSPLELAPEALTADLSPFAGQTVRLRIAVVDKEEVNAIVDGVTITSSPIVAPPAATPTPPPPASSAPSNLFTEGRLMLNKRTGTARLAVSVPDAGTLIAADARRKLAVASRRRSGKPAPIFVKSSTVTTAGGGTVQLPIKPTAAALKVLRREGSLPIEVTLTFIPSGGAAATQSYSTKLVRRLRAAPAPPHA